MGQRQLIYIFMDVPLLFLSDIIRSVSDFTGAAPQHDDLTIIVVSAENQ